MDSPKRQTRSQQIMLGFVAIIVLGALLLMLPFATREGQHTTIVGALFSAISATCVTGLVVYDTWSHWTVFGQIVLITLIQIGGLGFITIGTFMLMLLRKKIGLTRRALIQDSLNTLQIQGSVLLVRRIIKGTVLFEGIGAILLASRFIPKMGVLKGIYYGIFHSISAFCNAGFDLMGFQEQYSSFSSYYGDVIVNVTIMALILIGGLGFVVWEDLFLKKWNWKRYRFQTKVVLVMTGILVVGGTILFLILENNNLFADMSIKERILSAAFSAVTPRTAGFNTVDTASLSNGSKILTMIFMFIGGCPGSTAGGIKTTTIFCIVLYIKTYLMRQRDCVAFKTRMNDDIVKKASVVFFINLFLAVIGCFIIFAAQPLPMSDILFEVFSAIGTVGMSTGITRELNVISKIVIMFLMYLGRMGSLTFAMSFTEHRRETKLRYPQEDIVIG